MYFLKGQFLQIYMYFLKGQFLQIYMYFLKRQFLQIYMYFLRTVDVISSYSFSFKVACQIHNINFESFDEKCEKN